MGRGAMQWNQQQNAYGMSGHHPNGSSMMPGMPPINRHMSNNYSNYNHSSNHPMAMNNHVGNMNTETMPPNQSLAPNASHSAPINNMPTSTSTSGNNTTKGAQAAAQAAVEAAAKYAVNSKEQKQPSMGSTGQRPNMPPYNQYGAPNMNYSMNPSMNNIMGNQSPPPIGMPGANWRPNHMGGSSVPPTNNPPSSQPADSTRSSVDSETKPSSNSKTG